MSSPFKWKNPADAASRGIANKMLSEDYDPESELMEGESLRDSLLQMVRTNRVATLGAIVIVVFALAALLASWVAPYDPVEMNLVDRLQPPSLQHWLGTDDIGRDVFSRILYGGRVSLMIGIVPSLISLFIGAALGLIAGYIGGFVDSCIMRLADIVLAFPSLLLAMVVMYIMGASLFNLFIALSMINWASTARVVRAQTLSLKQKEFIEAAQSMGVRRPMIMFRHILPNCLANLIVMFTMDIPGAIMSEASLSFLGVGAQPPTASWGLMVSQGKQFANNCPWLILAPGFAVLVIVMAFNFLGDGLRDAIDPYLKN